MIPKEEVSLHDDIVATHAALRLIVDNFDPVFTDTTIAELRDQPNPLATRYDPLWSTPSNLSICRTPYENTARLAACTFLNALPIEACTKWVNGVVITEYTVHPAIEDLLAHWEVVISEFREKVAADKEATRLANIRQGQKDVARQLEFWNEILGARTQAALPADVQAFFEAVAASPTVTVDTAKLNELYETYV